MATEKQNKRPIPPVDHSGHRKRLKKRAELEGLEHFEPHNLLELLLFYTIPRADTNDTGHRLLDEFGSFAGVLDASPQALMRVHGVGRETALFLSMLPAVFRMYVQSQTNDYRGLKNLDEAGISQNRGVKAGYARGDGNYYVNSHSDMPSCLVELGFINSEEDNNLFDKNLDAYAQAIADAVILSLES